jgi:hypothetical protein
LPPCSATAPVRVFADDVLIEEADRLTLGFCFNRSERFGVAE